MNIFVIIDTKVFKTMENDLSIKPRLAAVNVKVKVTFLRLEVFIRYCQVVQLLIFLYSSMIYIYVIKYGFTVFSLNVLLSRCVYQITFSTWFPHIGLWITIDKKMFFKAYIRLYYVK